MSKIENIQGVNIPSLADGNVATRILNNPAASVAGGHAVPDWQQFTNHLVGLKHRIFELTSSATMAYNLMTTVAHRQAEATTLINRLMYDAEQTINILNNLSHRVPADYNGAARNADESQNIVFSASEATEAFTSFLTGNTLTIHHLQEIHTQIQLAQKQDAALQA